MKQVVIWCGLNLEQDMIASCFGNRCVSIYGSLPSDEKESRLYRWLDKEVPILVTKPSIFGFGLNLQQCSDTVFVGLSDSFESLFQSTKRFHRHGQKSEVHRHLIISEAEGSVLANVQRKELDFMKMIGEMVEHTKNMSIENVKQLVNQKITYKPIHQINLPEWLKEGGY
jgi:superfamily II DNA helicase RecQ